jgi:hypothetical protein
LSTRLRVSLKHALLLGYLLLLLLVVVLLVREESGNQPAFSLSNSERGKGSATKTLTLHGENFHPGINGVVAKVLVNEEALLWHQFTDVSFRKLDVRDNLGLISYNKHKIVSVSLPEGGKPSLLDSMDMPGRVGQVEIVDHRALVGLARGAGVSLVDMSDPEELKLAAHYPLSGHVNSMVEEGNAIYYTGINAGVLRLDLAAKHPVPETLATMDSPWRMTVQSGRIAVGTLKGRVHLFDIDKTGALVEGSVLDFQNQVRGVAFTDETLTIVFSDNSLSVFNLSAWPNLIQSGRLLLPAQPMDIYRVPGQERVVVALISAGLGLVDVSQEKSPNLSGWFKTPKTYKDFIVSSETILATSSEGLDSISLEEIEKGDMSKLAPEVMISNSPYLLQAWNTHVYGYNEQGLTEIVARPLVKGPSFDRYLPIVDAQGVRLYEQTEIGLLLSVGSVAVKEGALDARFYDGHLYVLYSDGLRVFSAEGSDELVAVGDLTIPGRVRSFELLGSGILMLATYEQGLLTVDIRDPKEPKQLSWLTLPRNLEYSVTRDILIHGQRAYISQGNGGLRIFDISSPQRPELVQVLDTPGHSDVMALHDDFLYVADGLEGLFVFDVSDRERVLPVGSLEVPVRITQIAVGVDGLIVSGHRGGTLKLPLLQRLQNVQYVSDSELAVDVGSVEPGQYIYLYDEVHSARVALDGR